MWITVTIYHPLLAMESNVAKIIRACQASLQECYQTLAQGGLVAFPTETVYGLGANALDSRAVEKIFIAKGRPKSDPLIVHIFNQTKAYSLLSLNQMQRRVFDILAERFWPGPLTIILPASNLVPSLTTANTGWVGLRVPHHHVALSLLEVCPFPLAAPSANLFGHVSPTTASHVAEDFKKIDDLLILDSEEPCQVGIESTVIKIGIDLVIEQLRPGMITLEEIESVLKNHDFDLEYKEKKFFIRNHTTYSEKTNEAISSPGFFLKHYAPSLPTYLLPMKINHYDNYSAVNEIEISNEDLKNSNFVVLDFHKKFSSLKKSVLFYHDLSVNGDVKIAAKNLFYYLRWAETECPMAKNILICFPCDLKDNKMNGLLDRIYRSASGNFAKIV